MADTGAAQYCESSPIQGYSETPVLDCLSNGLPNTGFDLGIIILIAMILLIAGLFLRSRTA